MFRLLLLIMFGAVWIALSEGIHQASNQHQKHGTRRVMAGPGLKKNNIFTRSLQQGKLMAMKRKGDHHLGKGGEFDPCRKPRACSGNGDCLSCGFYAENDKGYTCECHDGYYGEECEYGDYVCNNVVCKNGGACYPIYMTENSFWCACEEGYKGQYCESKCELSSCFKKFHEKHKDLAWNDTLIDMVPVNEDTCKSLTDELDSCIDNIKQDGVSLCGCDEWDIEKAVKYLEDSTKFKSQYCYLNFGSECEDPEVQQCIDAVFYLNSILEGPIPGKMMKEEYASEAAEILSNATTCLKELKDKGKTKAEGCSVYESTLGADPEQLQGYFKLSFSGCPIVGISSQCSEDKEFCKDGDIDNDVMDQAQKCIKEMVNLNENCTGAEKYIGPTKDELEDIKQQCAIEQKVAEYKTNFGCKDENTEENHQVTPFLSMKKSLKSFAESIKNMKAEKAMKNERENRIKTLVSLLKKALAEK